MSGARLTTGRFTVTYKANPDRAVGNGSRVTLTLATSGSASRAVAIWELDALTGICAVHTDPLNDSEYDPPSNNDPPSWTVVTLTLTLELTATRSIAATLNGG